MVKTTYGDGWYNTYGYDIRVDEGYVANIVKVGRNGLKQYGLYAYLQDPYNCWINVLPRRLTLEQARNGIYAGYYQFKQRGMNK